MRGDAAPKPLAKTAIASGWCVPVPAGVARHHARSVPAWVRPTEHAWRVALVLRVPRVLLVVVCPLAALMVGLVVTWALGPVLTLLLTLTWTHVAVGAVLRVLPRHLGLLTLLLALMLLRLHVHVPVALVGSALLHGWTWSRTRWSWAWAVLHTLVHVGPLTLAAGVLLLLLHRTEVSTRHLVLATGSGGSRPRPSTSVTAPGHVHGSGRSPVCLTLGMRMVLTSMISSHCCEGIYGVGARLHTLLLTLHWHTSIQTLVLSVPVKGLLSRLRVSVATELIVVPKTTVLHVHLRRLLVLRIRRSRQLLSQIERLRTLVHRLVWVHGMWCMVGRVRPCGRPLLRMLRVLVCRRVCRSLRRTPIRELIALLRLRLVRWRRWRPVRSGGWGRWNRRPHRSTLWSRGTLRYGRNGYFDRIVRFPCPDGAGGSRGRVAFHHHVEGNRCRAVHVANC